MLSQNVQIVCGAGIVSGKEIISLLLARGLRDAGWNPEFVTSCWSDGTFVHRLEQGGFNYQRLRLGFISASLRMRPLMMTLDQLRFWPALAYRYSRHIAATAPQAVIHTNWHHALLLLPLLRQHRDIFWVHELFPNVPHYAQVLRAIAKRVGRVVCISHAVAGSVLALGVPESHVTVIYNGLPAVELMPTSTDPATLRLGIVGQIGAWKGHEDLLDALALLARDGISVKLRIFGAGDRGYIEALKARIVELNLDDQVQWRGVVNKQPDIYREIDVCVQPSRFDEPFGMSALEASAFGRPVIGSSRGGLPEIIEHGVTGLIVEAQRPDQLAQAIKSFARQPDLLRTMGESARKRARAEFSFDSFVSRYITVIEEITGEGTNMGMTSLAP